MRRQLFGQQHRHVSLNDRTGRMYWIIVTSEDQLIRSQDLILLNFELQWPVIDCGDDALNGCVEL